MSDVQPNESITPTLIAPMYICTVRYVMYTNVQKIRCKQVVPIMRHHTSYYRCIAGPSTASPVQYYRGCTVKCVHFAGNFHFTTVQI